tara:strand:+ start:2002 stop:2193 length:192 start_codon:yes stop_codon:yes gene_type:complete
MSYDKDILIETYDDVLARVTAEKEALSESNERMRGRISRLKKIIEVLTLHLELGYDYGGRYDE